MKKISKARRAHLIMCMSVVHDVAQGMRWLRRKFGCDPSRIGVTR